VDALSGEEIQRAVRQALEEDLGSGDVTSLATIPADAQCSAVMRARQSLCVAGLAFAATAFRIQPGSPMVECLAKDAQYVDRNAALLRVTGATRAILAAERVALNFVQQLSGVATLTHAFVQAVHGTSARILDTRKTTPGWRRFQKYAVRCGGGTNHRMGLFDMILIKDNHLAALREARPNAIAAAVERARAGYPQLKVEVEADTLDQVRHAVEAGADFILLDNMDDRQLREAVRLVAGRAKLEASGGITLQTVRTMAETGVDFISVGALTHSAPAADIGLDFET
jgi:nicotinate-nucleotide pyrophosphorylase (carboxylating)